MCWTRFHLWSQNDVITSWARLTATSNCFPHHIQHIQSNWAHWYAIHGHTVSALHGYTHPTWLTCWGSGSLVESNDVIMSWLRLTATSNCFLYPYKIYKSVWAHWYAVHWHTVAALHSFTQRNRLGCWGSGSLVACGVKMMSLCHVWGWQPTQTASPIHLRHLQNVWAH